LIGNGDGPLEEEPDDNARDTYYACNAGGLGGPAAGAPLLALVLVLRRRRASPSVKRAG
jgi:uncharacterized protein (TIGR03382 family)